MEVIIIVTEIKKKFYDILTDLGYTVVDNRESIDEETPFPHVLLRINTGSRDRVKDVTMNKLRFTIDIFSEYNGEAEILDIEEKVFDATKAIYDIDHVIYVQESSFRIIDDKSTGVMMKHGILNYLVITGGIEQEVKEENEENSNTP